MGKRNSALSKLAKPVFFAMVHAMSLSCDCFGNLHKEKDFL